MHTYQQGARKSSRETAGKRNAERYGQEEPVSIPQPSRKAVAAAAAAAAAVAAPPLPVPPPPHREGFGLLSESEDEDKDEDEDEDEEALEAKYRRMLLPSLKGMLQRLGMKKNRHQRRACSSPLDWAGRVDGAFGHYLRV